MKDTHGKYKLVDNEAKLKSNVELQQEATLEDWALEIKKTLE